jgi:hypothetical protein
VIGLLTLCLWAEELSFEGELGSSVTDLVVAEDQTQVAFIGTDLSFVLSAFSWEITEISACGSYAMGGAVFVDELLYIGCDDGSISSYDGTDILQNVFVLDASSVMGLWENDGYLYAIAKSDSGGNPRVHALDISSGQESSGGYPSTLGYSGYQDAERVGNYLIISQGSTSISKIDLSSGSASRDNEGPTAVSLGDVLAEPNGTNALIAGGDGGIIRFLTASNDTQYALNLTSWSDVTALAIFGEYLWLSDAQTLRAYDVSGYGATVGSEERVAVELTASVLEMGALEDHLIYVSSEGVYGIISELPWVEIVSLTQETDGSYSLSFTATVDGTYQLFLGNSTAGTALASGSVSSDTTTEIVFEEPGGLEEGENRIWLDVDGGHDSIILEVDTPPEAVDLSESSLSSGNEKLQLSFDGLSASDIESYQIYLSEEEFGSSDYETGGPDSSVLSLESLLVAASAQMVVELYPLENQTQYYVGVRAIDRAGTEGPMSNVVYGTPKPSYGVSDLSGEAGGFSGCASTGGRTMGWMMFTILGVMMRRRVAPLLLAGLCVFSTSSEAQAADTFGESKSIMSKAFSFDYSMTRFDSQAIQAVFGEENMYPGLNFGASVQVLRVLEFSSGLGLWRQNGMMVQDDGTSSSDAQTLSMVPLQLSAGLRLDFLRDQIIVPFASGGIDYWLWQEDWVEGESTEKISGGKSGWHYRVGGEVLLDIFDRSSSSMLDVRYHIKDTYLVFSYQKQEVGDEGLIFNGESYMLGLRMQY